jgi:hypothetical protein
MLLNCSNETSEGEEESKREKEGERIQNAIVWCAVLVGLDDTGVK